MKRLVLSILLLVASTSTALADAPCLLGVSMGGNGTCSTSTSGGATTPAGTTTTPATSPSSQPGSHAWITAAQARHAYATGRVITGEVRDPSGNITWVTYRPVTSMHSAGRVGQGDDMDLVGVELGPESDWVPYVPANTPASGQLAVALWNEVAAIDAELTTLVAQRDLIAAEYWSAPPAHRSYFQDLWSRAQARIDYLVRLRATKAATYEQLRVGAR